MVSNERERGILSSADREYARDPEKWSESKSRAAASQRKNAIANRIQNAIIDFNYLADEDFPQEILDSAFQTPDDFEPEEHRPLTHGKVGGISFQDRDPIIQGFTAAVSLIYRSFPMPVANRTIELGVIQATNNFYPDHNLVDASYDPVLVSKEDAHERARDALEQGLKLTGEQVLLLLEQGEVDPTEVAEHVQEKHSEYFDRQQKTFEQTRKERMERFEHPSDNSESVDGSENNRG